MASFQHYEDLRAVFARLNRVLPGRPKLQEEEPPPPGDGWDWRNTVIEAKPARLQHLTIDAAGVFRGQIPSQHQTCMSRRWYVAERTQVATSLKDGCPSLPGVLPTGTSLWHPSEQARRLAVLATHDAKCLFDEQTQDCTLPAHDEWRTAGRLTLFATPGPAELCFRDCLRLLAPRAPYLARLAQEYGKSIAWMFGFRPGEFEEACRLHITWHARGAHTPARLLPASPCRYENGPIVHVGMGRPVVTHDLIPAIGDPSCVGQEHPVRLEVGEGIMVCTDGHARMRYSHGFPSARIDRAAWFSLTFLLDCTRQSVPVAYDRETRALIMATPIRKDHVVATQNQENAQSPTGGPSTDPMGALVKDMRLRLRVAESHVVACRHEGVKAGAAGVKSSSSMSLE